MKILSMVVILAAGLLISGCWDSEKEKSDKAFMSTLSRCDDCKLEKPLLGPHNFNQRKEGGR